MTYNGWTPEKLLDFEDEIRQDFCAAKIRYPIHLSKGNERQLIDIFAKYDIAQPENWVFSSHRSHLHALLKGIPADWLREQIHRGNSMHIMSPEYKFFSSSIVGGCCPIAVGVAMGTKRDGLPGHVFVFVGDMAAESGIFHECRKYADRFDLPVTFIIEDNGLSTNTPSSVAWCGLTDWEHILPHIKNVDYYKYERQCEHINVGQHVEFR